MRDIAQHTQTIVSEAVLKKFKPMAREMLDSRGADIHSVHIVGSAVQTDYDASISKIASVVVLHHMDLSFLAFLAPLGKKFGKEKISAPFIFTLPYIHSSIDVFPIEFLDYKLLHHTIHGEDVLQPLSIDRQHLRLQVERELKGKMIHVRQGVLSSLGRRDNLEDMLIGSFTGSMALFRGVITLFGNNPPLARLEVIASLGDVTGVDVSVFRELLRLKSEGNRPSEAELYRLFERYHAVLEALGKIVDELQG